MNSGTYLFNKFYQAVLLTLAVIAVACNGGTTESNQLPISTNLSDQEQANTELQMPQINTNSIEIKTFEVKDSSGKTLGWGYDIYTNNKKTIHQSIIPAIQGNTSFKQEADARKTAQFAVEKMRATGSLPTLSKKELDSLGVLQ